MLGSKTVVALIAVAVLLAGGGYYKLVYEPRLWPKEIDFYSEDAMERGAGVVWNEWPVFGDVREMNISLYKFGEIDSWEAWQAWMTYVEKNQEGFIHTYEEISRVEMRELVKLHRMSRTANELPGPPILLYDSESKIIWMHAIGPGGDVGYWVTYYWKAPK